MKKMTRNEFLISTLKEIAEEKNEEEVKKFVDLIDFNDNEKNSLYAKCIEEIKELDKNNDKFIENYKIICDIYLNMEKGKTYYKVKCSSFRFMLGEATFYFMTIRGFLR